MTLASNGSVAGYNDYYPFGLTMPGRSMSSSADPRYQYISVEQDVETGYLATGDRTYDSWSGKFGQTDPLDFLSPSESPYAYSFNNPATWKDPFGLDTMYAYNEKSQLVPIQITPEGSQTAWGIAYGAEGFKNADGTSKSSTTDHSITGKRSINILDHPAVVLQAYSTTKTHEGKSGVEDTYDLRKGTLESTSYKGTYGTTITKGVDGSVTLSFGPLTLGFTTDGKYIMDLSSPQIGSSQFGLTLQVDNEDAFVKQATDAFENLFNTVAQSWPSQTYPALPTPIEAPPPAIP